MDIDYGFEIDDMRNAWTISFHSDPVKTFKLPIYTLK